MTLRLQLGKTYNHSRSGATDKWKIIRQWNDNIFEGKAVANAERNTVYGKSVLFNENGYPIGAEGRSAFNPDGWHLVEPTYHEVKLFFGNGEESKWERASSTFLAWKDDTQYLVRENGNNCTLTLMEHGQFIEWHEENYPR